MMIVYNTVLYRGIVYNEYNWSIYNIYLVYHIKNI